jgi:hypothetical protein
MTQTIQRTAKSYKAMIAIGKISAILGTPILFFNHHGAAAGVALIAGIILYFVGKVGAWWSNG